MESFARQSEHRIESARLDPFTGDLSAKFPSMDASFVDRLPALAAKEQAHLPAEMPNEWLLNLQKPKAHDDYCLVTNWNKGMENVILDHVSASALAESLQRCVTERRT